MFRYTACAEVPLPPGLVHDWWTDFGPDDHAGFLPFASVTRRTVVRRPGTVLGQRSLECPAGRELAEYWSRHLNRWPV